jgi:hypothetical protein
MQSGFASARSEKQTTGFDPSEPNAGTSSGFT